MNLDRLGNYKMMGNVTNNLKMLVDQSGIGSEVGFFRLTLVQIEDDAASLLELQLRLKNDQSHTNLNDQLKHDFS